MSTAERLAPAISEPLSWAEICARYSEQWVCLVDMVFTKASDTVPSNARVIGHGKTRRDPVEQAMHWRDQYELIGHFFTGRIAVRPLRPSVVLDDETRDAFRRRY